MVAVEQTVVRPVRRREMEGDIIICKDYPEEPVVLDPVYRGILLWLREQAYRAEMDPSREWDGFEAEWTKLLAGTHPDPCPDLIIYGKQVDGFDPSRLEAPIDEIKDIDFDAYADMKRERNRPQFDYPAMSQQLFAAYCLNELDTFLHFVR